MTDAAGEARDDQSIAQASASSLSPGRAVLWGLRQPIVPILLLIAFFTAVSGKPLDGVLMLAVASLLTLDAARSRRQVAVGADGPGVSARIVAPAAVPVTGRRSALRKLLVRAPWLAAGALYCVVVGSFTRYSWPATTAVVALGCLMIAIGWQGPLARREPLTGEPLRRAWLWAVVLVTGGLLELGSLLQQPHLTTDSYAHPTISALTDPVLASFPGRSAVLGGWLITGWFLVTR